MKIKYDINLMKYMSLFETVTRAKVKDCFEDHILTFVVDEGEIGKAIGKKAANIKKLEKMLNRKIKIVEFNSTLIQFIRNLVFPVKLAGIEENEGVVTLKAVDMTGRGILIGKSAQNLRNNEKVVQRYFELKELKVI